MKKDVLKTVIESLKDIDMHKIITIDSNVSVPFYRGLVGLTIKFPYNSWIDVLNVELRDLGMKKVFNEYFYLHEIDLPEDSGDEEIYNKLDENLKFYLSILEELVRDKK